MNTKFINFLHILTISYIFYYALDYCMINYILYPCTDCIVIIHLKIILSLLVFHCYTNTFRKHLILFPDNSKDRHSNLMASVVQLLFHHCIQLLISIICKLARKCHFYLNHDYSKCILNTNLILLLKIFMKNYISAVALLYQYLRVMRNNLI